jgi:Tfp pilus assembly protein PilO
LPGIASARQVNEDGLDLAGSQMGQLQKIEELTLYTLQLQSQGETQQARIADLEAGQQSLAEQRARIDRLETQLNRAERRGSRRLALR